MSSNAATPSFDWSKVSTSTKIAGGGAILLLISAFMSWVTCPAAPISASQSGWSAYSLGKLAALAGLVAIAVLVIEHARPDVALPVAPALALVVCGAIGLFCAVWRIIFVPDSGVSRHRRRPLLRRVRGARRRGRADVRRLAPDERGVRPPAAPSRTLSVS